MKNNLVFIIYKYSENIMGVYCTMIIWKDPVRHHNHSHGGNTKIVDFVINSRQSYRDSTNNECFNCRDKGECAYE